MGIKFIFFKALAGDSILVSTDKTNILIDGGYGKTYKKEIKPKIGQLEKLDLVVLTHTDEDHICGLIEMLNKHKRDREKINKLWFNSTDGVRVRKNGISTVSSGNGILLQHLIKKYNIPHSDNIFLTENQYKRSYSLNSDIRLHLLSPFEEDILKLNEEEIDKEARFCNGRIKKISEEGTLKKDIHLDEIDISKVKFGIDKTSANNSSIAFILEYNRKNFLFLADANIETINRSLRNMGYCENNRLEVNFVKVSHHGSKNNINSKFLDIVKTNRFIILTDGKSENNNHPNKEIFSLILKHRKREKYILFILNYKEVINKKFHKNEFKKYNFRVLHRNCLEIKDND